MRVLGRSDELCAVDGFLDGVAAGFQVLLICGEPGIGKTTLWEEGRVRAEHLGYRVLSGRAVAPEAALGYAALGDLFSTVPDAVLNYLPDPQRHALRVALLRADAGDRAPDQRSVATAALTSLRVLAQDCPLLIAIDDLGWLDAASARVLGFVLRRLGPEQVGLLATARTDGRGALPRLATDEVHADRVIRMTPTPLDVAMVRELVADRLGFELTQRVLQKVHEASGGNPYFALELARTPGVTGGADGPDGAGDLPVPSTLRRLVLGRVRRLPRDVRHVLLAAALAPGASVAAIAGAAAEPSTALLQLETAQDAGIVDLRGGRVLFTHPLLRSVVANDAQPAHRRAAHRRLAGTISGPTERARHLAMAAEGPDAAIAATVSNAAHEAYLRGASETASELSELAVRLTPSNEHRSAMDRMLASAEYRFESGDPARARAIAADLVASSEPGPSRAATLARLAKYQRYAGDPIATWLATLGAALTETAETDVALLIDIHVAMAMAAFNGGDPADAPSHVTAVARLAEQHGDPARIAQVAGGSAWLAFVSGEGVRTDLVDRAIAAEPPRERSAVEVTASYPAAVTLAFAGDLDRARRLLEQDRADAVARGDETSLPTLLWLMVLVQTWSGDWPGADRYAEEGMRAAELSSSPSGISLMVAARAYLRASQGRAAEARDDAERARDVARQLGRPMPLRVSKDALALLELSLGRPADVHAQVGSAAAAVLTSGLREPGLLRFLPDEVEALIRLGELDSAERLLAPFAERAAVLERTWAVATAARCHALLAAGRGDLVSAQDALARALSCTDALGMPFEEARTHLVAGEIHRRARHKREASEHLLAARDTFDRLGAQLWSERCGAELDRTGLRVAAGAGTDGLTAMEQRVAALAAVGYTSRQISTELFTGIRTVETHLQRAYRKLGVRSRVELSRRLAERGKLTQRLAEPGEVPVPH